MALSHSTIKSIAKAILADMETLCAAISEAEDVNSNWSAPGDESECSNKTERQGDKAYAIGVDSDSYTHGPFVKVIEALTIQPVCVVDEKIYIYEISASSDYVKPLYQWSYEDQRWLLLVNHGDRITCDPDTGEIV